MTDQQPFDLPGSLRELRKRAGLTLQELSERAEVGASFLSKLERGLSSPTLATLRRILKGLGADLESFFANTPTTGAGTFVFRREGMRAGVDAARRYTFMLPRREGMKLDLVDEFWTPTESAPEYEVLDCDVAGTVLLGTLELDIKGEAVEVLRAGDAFYIPAGRKHRGRCLHNQPARLVTAFVPPRY